MIPLRDRLIVKMYESLSDIVYIPADISKWHESKDQLSNRGIVVAAGNGKRHDKTAVVLNNRCHAGDVVRFSELQYPFFKRNGDKYAIISDSDVVGVESL